MGTMEEELGLSVRPERLEPRKEQGNSSGKRVVRIGFGGSENPSRVENKSKRGWKSKWIAEAESP